MTQKHFVAITKTFKVARSYLTSDAQRHDFDEAVAALIQVLSQQNPYFDRERFLKAIA